VALNERLVPWLARWVLPGALLLLTACASSPRPPPEPALRKQAIEAETDGARRYARGDYSGAIRRFSEAGRLQQSLDDLTAAARNHLNQAHAELALGQTQAALNHAGEVSDGPLLVQALQLQAQANLALGKLDTARELLDRGDKLCASKCSEHGSLLVLRARVALADGNARQALADAQAALPSLKELQEEREASNAWRLIAAARLTLADLPAALAAAQTALEMDRHLALPEKIARDWLLLGDIQRRAGNAVEAKAAYQRARAVAQAAGLDDIVKLAAEAIMEKAR
jgi:tetratricopeptide (TPR) repeat protein